MTAVGSTHTAVEAPAGRRRALRRTVLLAFACLLVLACAAAPALASVRPHPYNQGCDALAAGQVAKAITFFKAALKLDAADTDALNNLAVCYLRQKEYGQAAPLLEKVLKINARYRGADLNQGAALLFEQKYDEAVPPTQKAKDSPPTANGKRARAAAYYNLGLIAVQAGRYADASAAFAQSVAAAKTPEAEVALACAQCAVGDYKKGLPALEEIATSKPAGPVAHTVKTNLAYAYYQRGMAKLGSRDVRGAGSDFRKSSELAGNAYASIGLALIDSEQGDPQGAAAKLHDIGGSSASPQLKAAVAWGLDRVEGKADRSTRWLKLLILIGGAVLFGSQAAAVVRAGGRAARRRLLAWCCAVIGIIAAGVLVVEFLDPFRTPTWLLVAAAIDIIVIVVVLVSTPRSAGPVAAPGDQGSA